MANPHDDNQTLIVFVNLVAVCVLNPEFVSRMSHAPVHRSLARPGQGIADCWQQITLVEEGEFVRCREFLDIIATLVPWARPHSNREHSKWNRKRCFFDSVSTWGTLTIMDNLSLASDVIVRPHHNLTPP